MDAGFDGYAIRLCRTRTFYMPNGEAIELETLPKPMRLFKMGRSQRESHAARHNARHGSQAFGASK
jgi:hypothetical protein